MVETDSCFADVIEVATRCTMGLCTLRLVNYGKMGATFVEVKTGTAVRLAPQLDMRDKAYAYTPGEKKHYYA